LEENQRQKEREARAKLDVVNHSYVTKVLHAQEGERHRIAQELHDSVQQNLVIIANRLQDLISGDYKELSLEARAQVEELRNIVLNTIDDVRRISHDLRPAILDQMGLIASLRWLREYLAKGSVITIGIEVNGVERHLNPEVELIIFRIAQEALNNILQHSQATRAAITVDFTPESYKMKVWDNGKGFLPPEEIKDFAIQGKLGLNGMRERSKLLGATLCIQSELGKGTTVILEVNI